MEGLSASVVILITIIGAAASVIIAYGFAQLFGLADNDDQGVKSPSHEQKVYMHELRAKNQAQLYWGAVDGSREQRPMPEGPSHLGNGQTN
jgi:hypothetical protein